LAYRYPRKSTILRVPKTRALYEGNAQKGFGVPGIALDGNPFLPGLTALPRSLPGHIAREVEWGKLPMLTGIKTLWIKEHSKPKQKKTSTNQ
jgi:hypothetical protein